MEKLELKHIQSYKLGKNGVKVLADDSIWYISAIHFDDDVIVELRNDLNVGGYDYKLEDIQLILHPLDLTKEIEHNGEKFVPLYELIKEDKAFTLDFIKCYGIEELKLSVYEKLLEWHFDIFGLIEKGLAIDINTLLL